MAVDGSKILVDVAIQLPLASLAANTYQFKVEAPILATPELENIRLAVDTYLKALYTPYKPLLSPLAFITGYVVYDVDANEALGPTSLNIQGTAVGQLAPPGVAFLVKGLTSNPKHQGRKFLPGVTSAVMDEFGNPTVAAVAVLTSIATAMTQPVPIPNETDCVLVPGVWSKRPLLPELFRPFTMGLAANVAAYQRRRKYGVGA